MKILTQFLNPTAERNIGITGLTNELFCAYLNERTIKNKEDIIVVTSTLYEANRLYSILQNYNKNTLLFPMDDFLTSEAVAISPDLKITRIETLTSISCDHEPKIVVTNLMGYLRFLPSKKDFYNNIINLKVNEEIDQEEFISNLIKLGYTRETLVTKTGEIGVRGFVIDVFSLGETHPYRIEFFGDTIESIRIFDEDTQKSIKEVKEIKIYPNSEYDATYESHKCYYLENNKNNIKDYLNDVAVFYVDYEQMRLSYEKLQEEIWEYQTTKDINFKGKYMFNLEEIETKTDNYFSSLNNLFNQKDLKVINYESKEVPLFQENIELINRYLKDNINLGKTIVICLKPYQIKNFIKYLTVPFNTVLEGEIVLNTVNIIEKELTTGFIIKNLICITENELFKNTKSKKEYRTKFKYASKIKDINKLVIGDYVVHSAHGIGIYNGIKSLNKNDLIKDYIEVLYAGKDKIYIPVEKIDLISKYTGNDGTIPKVHKLGGTEWQKTKLRVKNKIKDIAGKLLKLYAERELKKGFAYSEDTKMQEEFEEEFSYKPTKDQLLAIKQIKEDMQKESPMDRLLCGDVGYGKTEVAFRAAFKAINDSKQVLYLCPTTILSNQHYENALVRFRNFPVNIALLNRFTSAKEVKRITEGIKDGTVDMVIGTHRLLSNDIKPKDLGLLIIDEEQRFGVTHKEKIKEYKSNIDVLTLTATPIPRTLQMSMAGIRSLSLIETPPVNRYPVQTYVIEENKQIIKDAIYKELSRNGQIFILYNRVEDITLKEIEISRIAPDARIVAAHGQMTKNELEKRMIDFINHEYDILLCTTIIETGIDIPNVNTLIILDANNFGLSQLYQIRGRVGRSNKIAYAYLMYKPGKVLTETAVKRLNVIKEFTELGSGFSIATRDLSIRGAGDILGSEQAGFVDTIGIDLYLKMLNEEVSRLKGEIPEEETYTSDHPLLEVDTHIDDSYVEESDLKIEIHKKINQIDSYDKLITIKEEIEDRFGKINETILIYMYQEWFEKLAPKVGIKNVSQNKNSIMLYFDPEVTKKLDGEKLFEVAFHITPMFRFAMKNNSLIIILDTIKLEKHYIYYLIELLENITLKNS